MITKDDIEVLKTQNKGLLGKLLVEQKDLRPLLYLLEHLGHLPADFDGDFFVPSLNSNDDRIRYLAVKNLGKLEDDRYFEVVAKFVQKENKSMVRREAVSTIGRMRSKRAIPFLINVLDDPDPKVVLQAVRALLIFKKEAEVHQSLRKLISHPNEMIQSVIRKEFFPDRKLASSQVKHTDSPDFMKNVVVHGDVREVLKYVPDESIHLTFTSPPYYNARDYSIYQSYRQYLEFLTEVFREVHRVTKEGRFFILNTSPIIIPRVSRQHSSRRYPITFDIHPYLIQMGWEFIDDIVWLKPEATAKNRNAGFLQHRKPLAYKPNPVTEYLMVYRKKTDKLIDWSLRQYDYDTANRSRVLDKYETSNLWKIDPKFDKEHSAVFPIELCNRVVKYYSYIGDLVFDPFAGSGTFGKSAVNLNRYFFSAEKEQRYIDRIRREVNLLIQPRPQVLTLQEFVRLSRGK